MSTVLPTNPMVALLLSELEYELAGTRRVLENVPEFQSDFRLHERSRSLASLAGHTADLVSLIGVVLTRKEFDFGTEHRTPLVMESRAQLLNAFDAFAAATLQALKQISHAELLEEFRFHFNGRVVFSGPRYVAYRINTLNHLIHHRAQLGYYLRANDLKVPALYGPSADEAPRYQVK